MLSVTEGVIESMKNRGRVRKSKRKIVVCKIKNKNISTFKHIEVESFIVKMKHNIDRTSISRFVG